MLKTLLKLIQRLWRRLTRRHRVDSVIFVATRRDLPSDLGMALYVVGKNPAQWAVLNCPCGCGERANARIGVAARNSWSLSISDGKASLSPSFLMSSMDGCGSHFFIRESRIIWV
jgi:hypothetical protein